MPNDKYVEPKLEEKPVYSYNVICPTGYTSRYIATTITLSGSSVGNYYPIKPDLADYVCVSTAKGTSSSE
jgi:hypothetical protein